MKPSMRAEQLETRWFELEPPVPERLDLETAPRASTVASYVLTRAAERSWEVLNQHLAEPDGGVFWIGGPAGCGKTHFLDYVIALQNRAGALDVQNTRRLVCGLELAGRLDGAELERYLFSAMAEQIGGDPRAGDIFRQMRGAAALNVALESARRTGVSAVTVAIDFGKSRCDAAADFFAMLAQVAASFRRVKFTVIAASTPTPRTRESILQDCRRTLSSRSIRWRSARFERSPLIPGLTVTVPTAPRSCRCRAWRAKCWPRRLSPADCRRG
jgi:hypothetical protein